jgi:UDP-N-acetylmuramyl pentapeptide phosphotransferase/UDP-N-acetylglucosamine-1-phosphate transferase
MPEILREIDWLTCCSFLIALLVALISIPVIIRVARIKHLMDMPNSRSVHKDNIPTLGGIAIFASFIIPVLLFSDFSEASGTNYILASVILLFFIGVKDDILIISATKKLVVQLLAALIVIIMADIRIKSFYGIFNLFEIPYISSVLFSMFVYIVIINAFNLIDGIDGLAGGIGVIIALTFGTWFFLSGHAAMATLSVSLGGALIGFLYFNFSTRRKIFMGDTGSLIIGFVIATLAIEFIDLNRIYVNENYPIRNAPVVAIFILSIPLFDALRLFITRLLTGNSPFQADRNHFHHILLKYRFSHIESSLILYSTNLFFISLAFTLIQNVGRISSLIILFVVFVIYWMIAIAMARHRRVSYSKISDRKEQENKDEKVVKHHMAN